MKDLIQRVLHHPDFNADEVGHDMHELDHEMHEAVISPISSYYGLYHI